MIRFVQKPALNDMNMESKRPKLPTRMIVETERNILGTNADGGVDFNLKDITLGRQTLDGEFSYYRLKNLKRTQGLEILVRSPEQLERVPFTEGQLERISDFLRIEPELERTFDCNSFVHKVHDIPHEVGVFNIDRWDIIKLELEANLQPADTICISHESKIKPGSGITHFAIYLGNGLYLSKFGGSGRLIATTLDEMKKGFGGDFVFLLKPKDLHV